MDEQLQQMIAFHKQLTEFKQRLQQMIVAVEEQHEQIEFVWQEPQRDDYDEVWIPLQEGVQYYLQFASEEMVEFLQQKIFYLNRYLHGG